MKDADELHARFAVSTEIAVKFPEAMIGIILARGLENGPSDRESRQALEDSVALVTRSAAGSRLEDPRLEAWRRVYERFGARPSKYLCSPDALSSRALKEGRLPEINRLVDHYNALSLRHLTPIGGEDLDRMVGRLTLRFAVPGDAFDIADRPGESMAQVPAGEVVLSDETGVTCRRWNWRQGRRTRLTEETRNAYFIVEAIQPAQTAGDLNLVMDELASMLVTVGGAQRLDRLVLSGTDRTL
jgi:DNA/RNA-binding domain of Phe-tRNA-synthetase-like protein